MSSPVPGFKDLISAVAVDDEWIYRFDNLGYPDNKPDKWLNVKFPLESFEAGKIYKVRFGEVTLLIIRETEDEFKARIEADETED